MKKIICDICGTTYPDTAEQCPICGYANNPADQAEDELTTEFGTRCPDTYEQVRGGRFSAANVRKRNQQPKNAQSWDQDDEDQDDELENMNPESNAILVALLVILIAVLLVLTGVIFFRYYLPNNLPEQTNATTEETQTEPTEESTEPTIPCTGLAITDGIVSVALKQAGDKHLLNVMVLPADTTDELVYSSSDEAVATVTSEGRVTAVGEGKAVITASCGTQSIVCTVICEFSSDEIETAEESTEPASEPLLDIDLYINYKDVTLFHRGETITFKFNKELNAEDIIWTSSKPEVATVENGVVVAVGHGNTTITARYGDQEVTCIIRCAFW